MCKKNSIQIIFLSKGVHGVVKNAAREQFGRLPYISDKGDVYYLDILVWRANVRLRKLPIFAEFAKALLFWTINPLEGSSRKVPLFEEDIGMEDEGDEDEEDG